MFIAFAIFLILISLSSTNLSGHFLYFWWCIQFLPSRTSYISKVAITASNTMLFCRDVSQFNCKYEFAFTVFFKMAFGVSAINFKKVCINKTAKKHESISICIIILLGLSQILWHGSEAYNVLMRTIWILIGREWETYWMVFVCLWIVFFHRIVTGDE